MKSKNRTYSTFGATLLTVSMSWTDRALGIVSILILARLLMPEDYGIVAMATLAVGLADVLLGFSVHVALIQNQNATQEHYDSAWTLRLLQTVVSMLILLLLAPVVADYFNDARVESVMRWLSLSVLLAGFENIGVVNFQKHMQFGAEFRFRFLRRIIGFTATLIAALILRDYWALVIGTLTGTVSGVVLSYIFHPMRPRIGFKKFGEIFHVSQWMLVNRIGTYFQRKLHRILVGQWSSTATMGAYTLADEISSLPAGELLAPINRALFPSFAKTKDDMTKLKKLFLLAQGVQTMVAVPIASGLALVATEAVPVLLGDKWDAAIAFIQVLALVNIVQALTTSGRWVLIVVGRVRASALFGWAQVVLFALIALTFLYGESAISLAILRLTVAGVGLWILLWMLVAWIPTLRPTEVIANSIRPLLAASAMALALTYLSPLLTWPEAAILICKIAVGGFVYITTIGLLWWLAGRPRGAESYALEKAAEIAGKLRQKTTNATP